MPKTLKEQRAEARARTRQPNSPQPGNDDARRIAEQLSESLESSFAALAAHQKASFAELFKAMDVHNTSMLSELAKQTAALTKAVGNSNRSPQPIKVESPDVEVIMPARPSALIAEYDDESGRLERFIPEYD